MADEANQEHMWLVEPPGPGQVTVQVAVGEGGELNDDQRAALEALLASLQTADAEVAGFASDCNIVTCKPKAISMPCAMLEGSCAEFSVCQIQQFGSFGFGRG